MCCMHVVYTECFKHTPKRYQCVPSAHIEWQIHQNIIILSEFLVSYYNGSIVKRCMSDCREHVQQNAWTFCPCFNFWQRRAWYTLIVIIWLMHPFRKALLNSEHRYNKQYRYNINWKLKANQPLTNYILSNYPNPPCQEYMHAKHTSIQDAPKNWIIVTQLDSLKA